MKAHRIRLDRTLIFLCIGILPALAARAQGVDCTASTKLICLLPFVTNAYLNANTTADTLKQASIFNGPIGTQLSQVPSAASAPGAVILFVNGNPEAYDNLGPILIDRPDSVGAGKLVLGFSYQHFDFYHLDGISMGSIPFVYQQTPNNSGQYPSQYVSQTEHVSIHYSQYVAVATYGLPRKTDISVVVPYSQVSIGSSNLNPETYFITSANTLGPSFALQPSTASGSAGGIGDVAFSAKHVFWSGGESGRGALAAGGAFRLPTGDSLNYLGSGAYGYNIYALASYKFRISPHVKIAYQWNTNSILLNPTGAAGANKNLPGGSQYVFGFDATLTNRFTWSEDLIATQFANSPYITKGTQVIPVSSATPSTSTCSAAQECLSTISTSTSTYSTANFSTGIKWKPLRHQNLILYANGLLQINDVGLLAHVSPSAGISYSFRPLK